MVGSSVADTGTERFDADANYHVEADQQPRFLLSQQTQKISPTWFS